MPAVLLLAMLAGLGPGGAAEAPQAAPLGTACGLTVPAPAALPPADSPPIVLAVSLCFEAQGGTSFVEPQTYLHYIHTRPSEPSRGVWVPYTDEVEDRLRADFRRLWDTRFLDDLVVEALDFPLANGVVGRVIVFRMEERDRVKLVDFDGNARVDRGAIDEVLKERKIEIRADSLIDHSLLRQVAGAVRDVYGQKGFQGTSVTPVVTRIAGGPKLVNVTFRVVEGPRVTIRDVEFVGNRDLSDSRLAAAMKANRAQGLLSFLRGGGVFQVDRYEEDADAVTALYRDRGYISARVGQPELRALDDSPDGQTRWVQLRIPVTEGRRYTVGSFTVDGNTKVATEALTSLFEVEVGETYREEHIRGGLEKARELYGAGGYYEFTAYPDLQRRDLPSSQDPAAAGLAVDASLPAIVDVTLRVQEGAQYFVNRIEFVGNTQTRDDVVRRELAIYEAGVFNTEALKYSVRRLNQLGYFKPLEGDAISVEKTPGRDDRVDVTVTVEEQNRNQLSFGLGASQYDGLFGNASFTTSNLLGRGESLTVAVQRGSRSSLYQLSFSEPYLLGRPLTAGGSLFSSRVDYYLTSSSVDYSEARNGFTLTSGYPLRRFLRLYGTYGYEVVDTASSEAFQELLSQGDPFGGLLLAGTGRYTQSSFTPSLVYDTVDNPFAPRRGLRLRGSYQYAGGILGGSTDFVKPDLEGILYVPVTARTALGVRAQGGWLWNYGSAPLPLYLRYFMGGETQIRGTDIRSVGPRGDNGVPLGGTRFVLFNAEYYYDVLPNVRALAFHDAGQAFAESEPVDLRRLRTSSGVELRVTLPVIGVPFRLIYAWNVYRDTFQPARTFKFAVGTTF